MLSLTRKKGELIYIKPEVDLDLNMTVGELFSNGVIKIKVVNAKGDQVRLGIEAPNELCILREELLNDT